MTFAAPTVALAGASGLVGRSCLRALVAARDSAGNPAFSAITLLLRRALPGADAPELADARVQQHVIDFERLDQHASLLGTDALICTLGTTIRVAGSRQAFRRVDYDYPLHLARHALAQGTRHFLVVSALGANPRSRLFYNRVKGEMERDLQALGYPALTILRPSLLLGPRSEHRPGEELAKRLAFLMPGPYKPVHADAVAACLVEQALRPPAGCRILSSSEIRRGSKA